MEAVHTDDDQVVPNPLEERSMVATSAEALEELGLDAGDLVDEAPSFSNMSCQMPVLPPMWQRTWTWLWL